MLEIQSLPQGLYLIIAASGAGVALAVLACLSELVKIRRALESDREVPP